MVIWLACLITRVVTRPIFRTNPLTKLKNMYYFPIKQHDYRIMVMHNLLKQTIVIICPKTEFCSIKIFLQLSLKSLVCIKNIQFLCSAPEHLHKTQCSWKKIKYPKFSCWIQSSFGTKTSFLQKLIKLWTCWISSLMQKSIEFFLVGQIWHNPL